MAAHPTPIDISTMPDLVHLAEKVQATNTPVELRRKNTVVAILSPVAQKQTNDQAIEETLALAGAWGERDWEQVERELARIRHESHPTPPFEL
jgi:hypothetical protein